MICLHVVIKRTHGRQKASGLFSSFGSADQDRIDSSSRSPLAPALFLNGSELLAPPLHSPRCTRGQPRSDVSLLPAGVPAGATESLLHLSLCCQSASEASLSRRFLRASVTPPREEKKRRIVSLQLPRITFKGPDRRDTEGLSCCRTKRNPTCCHSAKLENVNGR